MENMSYHLKSLRHNFAKTACKGDSGVGVATVTLLTAALMGGGLWTIADERPDNLTTPQTAQVMTEIQADLTALQKDFAELGGIEARLQSGDYTTAEYGTLQDTRSRADWLFTQNAEPVLNRILFSPHLSEAQAENLMDVFKNTVKDPGEIHRRYDIADYSFLRDTRDEVIKKYSSTSVEEILDTTQRRITRRNDEKWLGFGMGSIPLLFVSLMAGCAVGDSRRLKNWAREKPQKPSRPKH